VALFVRPRSFLARLRPTRLAGWWLPLLLVGSCLNPQPDPFPQADNGIDATPSADPDRASQGVGVMSAPPATPLAPAPQAPGSPGANNNPTSAAPSAEAPAEDVDAGAPPPDAGTDAGADEGSIVGGE
jgi:hypothetical protein